MTRNQQNEYATIKKNVLNIRKTKKQQQKKKKKKNNNKTSV